MTAGLDLTYTLVTTNTGPSTAEGVTIRDLLPAGVEVQSVTGTGPAGAVGCTSGTPGDAGDPATCDFGTLAPTETGTMTIAVTVDPSYLLWFAGDTLINDASTYSDNIDDDTSNNHATNVTTVEAVADVSVDKSASPEPVTAGEALSYDVTVTNAGPSTADEVTLVDQLPAGVTFVSATVPGTVGATCGANAVTGLVTCDLGSLLPGAVATAVINVIVEADVPTGTTLTNDANAWAAETVDCDDTNNAADDRLHGAG